MTEDQLEQEALSWLVETGYTHRHGADIAPDSTAPERSDYRQVLLRGRLSAAIHRLNPGIPTSAHDDAVLEGLYARLKLNRESSRQPAALLDTLLPRLISGQLRLPEFEKDAQAA